MDLENAPDGTLPAPFRFQARNLRGLAPTVDTIPPVPFRFLMDQTWNYDVESTVDELRSMGFRFRKGWMRDLEDGSMVDSMPARPHCFRADEMFDRDDKVPSESYHSLAIRDDLPAVE